jgi:hypothetical protein
MRRITTPATSFSSWTVSNHANPLPVELSRFTAERQGAAARLRWATASERNNAQFEVESSADGQYFRRIATVPSRSTSGQGAAYEASDLNLNLYGVATVFYRLRQVDRDSTVSFSPVRPVTAGGGVALRLQAYPNPFREGITVALEASAAGTASMVLRDALGRAVWQQTVMLSRGGNSYMLVGPAALPPGVYSLTLTQGAQQRQFTVTHQ